MKRRTFIKSTAMASGAMVVPDISHLFQSGVISKDFSMGIQVGAVSFYDEGADKVLDVLQENANINTIYIPVFAYNRGLAGRQVPGYAFPDHGSKKTDVNFRGGYYATMNESYYQKSIYKPKHARATELGDYDVLADVIPKAKKRGIKIIAFFADNFSKTLPHADKLNDINYKGNLMGSVNLSNPYYLEFVRAMMEDCIKNYDIDGILWRTERPGPLSDLLSLHHKKAKVKSPVGFDEYNIALAKEEGIDVARVKKAFHVLSDFTKTTLNGTAPIDGYYVNFWRILFQYPELLQWQHFMIQRVRDIYQMIYQQVKTLNPDLTVGWALSFKNMYNPFYRAQQDITTLTDYSDFLKIVMYTNVGGARLFRVTENMTKSLYGDMNQQECLDFISNTMGYKKMNIEHIKSQGLPSSIITKETQRAKATVKDSKTKIYAAVDIDIPPDSSGYDSYLKKMSPEDVTNSVNAAIDGHADGIIMARKYSEMNLANIQGASKAKTR